MKPIKDINEALEAEKQGLLVDQHNEPWEVSSMQVNEVLGMIEFAELFWKPETVELREFRTNDASFPVVYIPTKNLRHTKLLTTVLNFTERTALATIQGEEDE